LAKFEKLLSADAVFDARDIGTQFTCFTSAKVQILTQAKLLSDPRDIECLVSDKLISQRLLALQIQKYKHWHKRRDMSGKHKIVAIKKL